jgi:RNA polymerase sigma-70 factor (ECF subfamily)
LALGHRNQNFAALYAAAHLDLLRYVLTLLPDRNAADDVVQETARVLCQKFDEYDPGQPFLPWARKIAYFEVLKHRKRQAVRARHFSDALVEKLAEERLQNEGYLAAQRDALTDCLGKLDPAAKRLLTDHFGNTTAVVDLATRYGKTPNALYISLHRIRLRLMECVNRALTAEGWS